MRRAFILAAGLLPGGIFALALGAAAVWAWRAYYRRRDGGDPVLAERLRRQYIQAEAIAELPEPTGRVIERPRRVAAIGPNTLLTRTWDGR